METQSSDRVKYLSCMYTISRNLLASKAQSGRAVASSIIGGGGLIFIYSCSHTLKTIDSIKEFNCAEHEYMNISPPRSPPQLSRLLRPWTAIYMCKVDHQALSFVKVSETHLESPWIAEQAKLIFYWKIKFCLAFRTEICYGLQFCFKLRDILPTDLCYLQTTAKL